MSPKTVLMEQQITEWEGKVFVSFLVLIVMNNF